MADFVCPKCSASLRPSKDDEHSLHTCHGCAGAWADADSLAAAIHDLSGLRNAVEENGVPTEFDCPACTNQKLVEVTFGDCALDVCRSCEGVFFDRGEWAASSTGEGTTKKVNGAKDFIVGELVLEGICSLIAAAGDALS